RHLINFLANSPAGTFFLASVDASTEIASAELLADLLEKQIDSVGREHSRSLDYLKNFCLLMYFLNYKPIDFTAVSTVFLFTGAQEFFGDHIDKIELLDTILTHQKQAGNNLHKESPVVGGFITLHHDLHLP
ncbi:hypothetical protein ACJX0J_007067, partial [Zea mays]